MKKVDLKFGQGNQPLLVVRIKRRLPDGTLTPYDISGTVARMYIKNDVDDPDEDAVVSYDNEPPPAAGGTGITYTDALAGEMSIQMDGLATATAKKYAWRLDLITNSRPRTVFYGSLQVVNT